MTIAGLIRRTTLILAASTLGATLCTAFAPAPAYAAKTAPERIKTAQGIDLLYGVQRGLSGERARLSKQGFSKGMRADLERFRSTMVGAIGTEPVTIQRTNEGGVKLTEISNSRGSVFITRTKKARTITVGTARSPSDASGGELAVTSRAVSIRNNDRIPLDQYGIKGEAVSLMTERKEMQTGRKKNKKKIIGGNLITTSVQTEVKQKLTEYTVDKDGSERAVPQAAK